METIASLTARHAQNGKLQWIGIRPDRRVEMMILEEVDILKTGISGDHYSSGGKRSVTLVQYEHLAVIASLLGRADLPPALLRRNLVVRGINLLGLRNREFYIGKVVLKVSGLCAPCSRMEEYLGPGGYSAVRGHGGITAEIVTPGTIKIGDQISLV